MIGYIITVYAASVGGLIWHFTSSARKDLAAWEEERRRYVSALILKNSTDASSHGQAAVLRPAPESVDRVDRLPSIPEGL